MIGQYLGHVAHSKAGLVLLGAAAQLHDAARAFRDQHFGPGPRGVGQLVLENLLGHTGELGGVGPAEAAADLIL